MKKDRKERKVKVIRCKDVGDHLVAVKVDRNALCRYGSGKKAKNCCGADTKYLSKKSNN